MKTKDVACEMGNEENIKTTNEQFDPWEKFDLKWIPAKKLARNLENVFSVCVQTKCRNTAAEG